MRMRSVILKFCGAFVVFEPSVKLGRPMTGESVARSAATTFLQVAGSQSAYALCCALLAGRAMPDALASGIFSFEASTKTAPGLRPSSAAISLAGNLPAILLSLAISSSHHGRLESGIRDTPFRTFHKIGNFRKSSRDRGRLIYSLAGQVSIRSIAPNSNEAVQ
jgi:hypothetical protein